MQEAFQFYEEVGKGRFTAVYKGRRRKTIEYVAVKCVEKHQLEEVRVAVGLQHAPVGVPVRKSRFRIPRFPPPEPVHLTWATQVQHEVGLMHPLHHVNVVSFFSWYSTKGHVWMVVEYCAGGTLDSILRQDRSLPPGAVKVRVRVCVCGCV